MNRYALTLKPVLAAIVLGACSTTPTMPEKAWKIAPVQTVRHGGTNAAAGYYALGRVKEGQGASTQAIDAYRKALAADPAHVATWNALGALQMQLGRTNDGLQALERAVSLAPSASHLHNNLGYALLLAGRDADAAKSLQRAVELDGANRRAWSNLATAYRRQGALDQAEFAEAHASGRFAAPASIAATTATTTSAPLPAAASPDRAPATTAVAIPTVPVTAPMQVARSADAPVTISAVQTTQATSAEPLPALPPVVSVPPKNTAEAPVPTTIETSTVALGFAPVALNPVRSAAPPMLTTTPAATLVKVSENVFELRNGPPPREAAIAEAAAIVTAAARPLSAAPEATARIAAANAPLTSATPQPLPTARYEISNGHGGEGLARRLAGLLGQQGVARPRLTNQPGFNQATSVLQYRDGHRASAEAFASLLPFRPEISAASTASLAADVRLVLGRDLTTSDACAVLGLCARVARIPAPKLAAAGKSSD